MFERVYDAGMNEKPSDALTKPPRRARTAVLAVAAIAVASGLGFGGYAVAQTVQQSAVVQVADEPTPEPEPNVAPVAAFTSAVSGLIVTFDGTGSSDVDGTITLYIWDFGDGATGVGATTSHAYAAYGAYTVRLTVTDSDGATAESSATVDLIAPPPEPAPPATPSYTYGNYPPGYPLPRIPGTDQPDTSACASGSGMTNGSGEQVCA